MTAHTLPKNPYYAFCPAYGAKRTAAVGPPRRAATGAPAARTRAV